MASIVEACAVRKVYSSATGPVAAVDGISVAVNPGEVFAIMGVSGSG